MHYKKTERATLSRQGNPASMVQSLLDQGRQWESNKEYLRSVECYLKVSLDSVENPALSDIQLMEKAWVRAGEISLKYLNNDQASKVVEIICPRLIKIKVI